MLSVTGDHPRPARAIAPFLNGAVWTGADRDARSIAPTLRSLQRRGLLERQTRRDGSLWALTDRGREVISA